MATITIDKFDLIINTCNYFSDYFNENPADALKKGNPYLNAFSLYRNATEPIVLNPQIDGKGYVYFYKYKDFYLNNIMSVSNLIGSLFVAYDTRDSAITGEFKSIGILLGTVHIGDVYSMDSTCLTCNLNALSTIKSNADYNALADGTIIPSATLQNLQYHVAAAMDTFIDNVKAYTI